MLVAVYRHSTTFTMSASSRGTATTPGAYDTSVSSHNTATSGSSPSFFPKSHPARRPIPTYPRYFNHRASKWSQSEPGIITPPPPPPQPDEDRQSESIPVMSRGERRELLQRYNGSYSPGRRPVRRAASEIEQPSPARIAQLKQQLWDDQERLQSSKSKALSPWRDSYRPETPPRAPEQKHEEELKFGSKYYEAAAAICLAHSPEKSSSSKTTDVASLVAKLTAVNRQQDPQEALSQIDAILKQQSQSPVPEEDEEDEPVVVDDEHSNSEDDVDDHTSVSSITNPTYQGSKQTSKKGAVNVQITTSGKPRPSKLEVYGKSLAPPSPINGPRRGRASVVPPASIEVGSVRKGRTTKVSPNSSPERPEEGIVEKLRKWDALSGEDDGGTKYPGSERPPDAFSNTTEELGSLVTKKDDFSSSHPWEQDVMNWKDDRGRPLSPQSLAKALTTSKASSTARAQKAMTPREAAPTPTLSNKTTYIAKASTEDDLEPSLSEEDDEEPTIRKAWPPRDHKAHAKSLADDFDSAWVALPSSAFFSGGRNTPTQRTSNARIEARNMDRHSNGQGDQDGLGERSRFRETGPKDDVRERSSPQIKEHIRSSPHSTKRGDFQRISPRPSEGSVQKSRFVARTPTPTKTKTAYDQAPLAPTPEDQMAVDNVEVSLVDTPTRKRGLRGFLGKHRKKQPNALSSHVSLGSRLDKTDGKLEQDPSLEDSEVPPPPRRGRLLTKSPGRQRARSLEERRPRNPSIARKFSRMLRVYDEGAGQY